MPAAVAVAALVVSAYSAYQQHEAASDQRSAERKRVAEQKAVNAQQSAEERRRQIREERVKRARILQASEGTGVSDSSGVAGGTGGIATAMQSNIGQNLGLAMHTSNISDYMQQSADAQYKAQTWGAVQGLSNSVFSVTSGSLFKQSGPQWTVYRNPQSG